MKSYDKFIGGTINFMWVIAFVVATKTSQIQELNLKKILLKNIYKYVGR